MIPESPFVPEMDNKHNAHKIISLKITAFNANNSKSTIPMKVINAYRNFSTGDKFKHIKI